jgi:hypothetical protein
MIGCERCNDEGSEENDITMRATSLSPGQQDGEPRGLPNATVKAVPHETRRLISADVMRAEESSLPLGRAKLLGTVSL